MSISGTVLEQPAFIERFWSHVKPPVGIGECWPWLAKTDKHGYTWVKQEGRTRLAHRVAYEIVHGKIPEGMTIDHLCRNRGCVNPYHLEPVTLRENLMRGNTPAARNARKTHCINGHPLSGDNLVFSEKENTRYCRICRNASARKHRRKVRGGQGQ